MDLNVVDRRPQEVVDTIKSFVALSIPGVLLQEEHFEHECISWIKEFWQEDRKIDRLMQFLKMHAGSTIIQNGALTKQGEQLKEKVVSFIRGLSVGWLSEPYHSYALLPFLPAPRIRAQMPLATHGTHTFGILAGRPKTGGPIAGIAPHARVIMIKAFDERGMSRKSTLIAALKKAACLSADIVNLSLKIADRIDTTDGSSLALEHMLGLVPYVVAASGNEGDPRMPGYQGAVESYPARFDTVAFDVGAFGLRHGTAHIAPFSQYEDGYGPLFVAPGQDIVSTDIAVEDNLYPSYAARSGTSMAAALMSGLVGLIVAEFKDLFSKQEILTVCYHAAYKPETTGDWQQKVVLGAFDARAALLVLHCLARMKSSGQFPDFHHALQRIFGLLGQPTLITGAKLDQVIDELVKRSQDTQEQLPDFKLPARVQRLVQEKPLHDDPWFAHAQTKMTALKINKTPLPSQSARV
jgi:hypothetical protein